MLDPLFEAVRYENLPHVRIECALPVAPAYGQCRVSCPCQRLCGARPLDLWLAKHRRAPPEQDFSSVGRPLGKVRHNIQISHVKWLEAINWLCLAICRETWASAESGRPWRDSTEKCVQISMPFEFKPDRLFGATRIWGAQSAVHFAPCGFTIAEFPKRPGRIPPKTNAESAGWENQLWAGISFV